MAYTLVGEEEFADGFVPFLLALLVGSVCFSPYIFYYKVLKQIIISEELYQRAPTVDDEMVTTAAEREVEVV
eukprot:CAMPEP_0183705324 /NCGR_PEP_ID=MMETSP0737-20130205/2461_1 /TAXON_ID=385413 /ORGANISM="Thalassiosira miniscula, Strain CCMP1093" /LENGTH=71 /DNA_ID=CAMNT_0025932461 /DNA_START=603 /DNA_END=818 /DNA_ORIENTATION=-